MEIDLSAFREMHPALPEDLALAMIGCAALSLERSGHVTPVDLRLDVDRAASQARLAWPRSDHDFLAQHDSKRLTEDGAEAIALALGHRSRGWRVVRRMQQGESADWLLEEPGQTTGRRIALEVSGVARGTITSRLTEKLKQVAESEDVDQRWAGVVGFEEPVAALRSSKVEKR